MPTLSLSSVDMETLSAQAARVRVLPIADEPWAQRERRELSGAALRGVDDRLARLRRFNTARANEATLWARVIYPLMELAESGDVLAWSQVTMSARHPTLDLAITGVIDGAFARDDLGQPALPLLLVVEAERGIDASDPLPQVAGAMLAVALPRCTVGAPPAEVFGAFVVTDKWTFLRGTVTADGAGALELSLAPSREYAVRHESPAIVAVMASIVERQRG